MKNLILLAFFLVGMGTSVSGQYLDTDNARVIFHYTDDTHQKVSVRTMQSTDASLYADKDVESVDLYGCIELSITDADGNVNTFNGASPGSWNEYDVNVPDATYNLSPADYPISNLLTVTRTGAHAVLYTLGQYKGKKYYLAQGQSLSSIVLQSWKIADGYSMSAHGKSYQGKKRQFNGAITEAEIRRFINKN